nr:TPA_asm: hypothetical protein [Tilapia lake virus]DBA09002.1 TPA_asm: hypothetical protein [Tilapia lake virus]
MFLLSQTPRAMQALILMSCLVCTLASDESLRIKRLQSYLNNTYQSREIESEIRRGFASKFRMESCSCTMGVHYIITPSSGGSFCTGLHAVPNSFPALGYKLPNAEGRGDWKVTEVQTDTDSGVVLYNVSKCGSGTGCRELEVYSTVLPGQCNCTKPTVDDYKAMLASRQPKGFVVVGLIVLCLLASSVAIGMGVYNYAGVIGLAEAAQADVSEIWEYLEALTREVTGLTLGEFCSIKSLVCRSDNIGRFKEQFAAFGEAILAIVFGMIEKYKFVYYLVLFLMILSLLSKLSSLMKQMPFYEGIRVLIVRRLRFACFWLFFRIKRRFKRAPLNDDEVPLLTLS